MSINIDLTENYDFANGELTIHEFITADIDNSVIGDWASDKPISKEEYDKLSLYTRLFGRRWHYTESISVFQMDEDKWREEMASHCPRCGKVIRVPWKRFHDLCPDCHYKYRGCIPWKPQDAKWSDDSRDILRMR